MAQLKKKAIVLEGWLVQLTHYWQAQGLMPTKTSFVCFRYWKDEAKLKDDGNSCSAKYLIIWKSAAGLSIFARECWIRTLGRIVDLLGRRVVGRR